MAAAWRRAAAVAAVAAVLLSAACGYRVVGFGGQLPGGITRVEVPIFENRTTRSDISRKLTEDFINRLVSSGKVTVVGAAAEAQGVIRGVVAVYRREPITFDASQKPLANRLTVVMDVELVANATGRALFAEKGVVARHDYAIGDDLEENDRREDEALARISELMSQKLIGLMLEGF
ncbi:MAG TPA: LPS assembly lipoprotein LptE [bacterium]